MNKPKEFPGKTKPEVEKPKPKESIPAASEIETPVPPQVMDPSALPAPENENQFIDPTKRKRKPSRPLYIKETNFNK